MTPVIIECGKGKIGVYNGETGSENETPCIIFTTDGSGKIGEETGRELPAVIPDDIKLATIFFTNKESVAVVIEALESVKDRFY
jgi:hypothetical protein